jgi:hypothetical protein
MKLLRKSVEESAFAREAFLDYFGFTTFPKISDLVNEQREVSKNGQL